MSDMGHEVPDKECSEPGCTKTYKPHHWGSKAAQKEGWFIQRNGDAWCPDHLPDWVPAWRAKQTKKSPSTPVDEPVDNPGDNAG